MKARGQCTMVVWLSSRRGRSLLLFVAVVFGLGGFACGAQPARDRALDIYFVNVLGGAATVLITGDRETIAIDSGWPGYDDRDPKRIVHIIKDRAGCDHLDHLVTTHWHRDHFGGVEGLARLIRIDHFWDRGLPEDRDSALDFPDGPGEDDALGIAYRKASAGKRKALRPGDTLPLSGLKALVLASGGKVIDRPAQRHRGTARLPTPPTPFAVRLLPINRSIPPTMRGVLSCSLRSASSSSLTAAT